MAIYLRYSRNGYKVATSKDGRRVDYWRDIDLGPSSSAFKMLVDKTIGTTYHSDTTGRPGYLLQDHSNLDDRRLNFEPSNRWGMKQAYTAHAASVQAEPIAAPEPLPKTVQALTDIVAVLRHKADQSRIAMEAAQEHHEVSADLLAEAEADLEAVLKRRKPKRKVKALSVTGPIRVVDKHPNPQQIKKGKSNG